MTEVELESRVVATLPEAWEGWTSEAFLDLPLPPIGAVVRLCPPAAVSEERLEEVRRVVSATAAAIRVVRRERALAVPEVVRRPSETGASLRQVVEALVDGARTEDRDALRAEVRELMDAEGL